MRKLLILLVLQYFVIACNAQSTVQSNSKEENNIRLLPKYGGKQKTKEQQEADQNFIANVLSMKEFKGDRRKISDHFIKRGFDHIYQGDPQTAMYRFNQAYLVDSTNSNIYWGYGGYFMAISELEKAKEQYEIGLRQDSSNSNLLTDLATYHLTKLHEQQEKSMEAKNHLDECISLLSASYAIDPSNQNTTYKLAVSYIQRLDCTNAWKYYNECKKLGGQPITPEFSEYLKKSCKE